MFLRQIPSSILYHNKVPMSTSVVMKMLVYVETKTKLGFALGMFNNIDLQGLLV